VKGCVYLKTLHDLRGTTLAGSLGVAYTGAVNVLFFPTIQNMEGLVAFLDRLTPVFKAMIGDVSAMARLEGFLRVKLFDLLPLLLAVFGVAHGAQLLAGELEHKHVDLLLARPVHRWRVVPAKFLAVATSLAALAVGLAARLALRVPQGRLPAGGNARSGRRRVAARARGVAVRVRTTAILI